jgi:hypothetical protein
MTVEQKLAFRQLVSDCLMEMSAAGKRNAQGEVLEVMHKLEEITERLIDANITAQYGTAIPYTMPALIRQEWRKKISGLLLTASMNDAPEKIVLGIHDLESFVIGLTEKGLRDAIGKPKFNIKKLPN